MAVSKTLRFEILRRDNFTCRYCGTKAPAAELHVDHVTPVTLGGEDKAENLVTSCVDCNNGKGKIPPDAPLVADVKADALRWAAAIEQAAREKSKAREAAELYAQTFLEIWESWSYGPDDDRKKIPLESDWKTGIERFRTLGLTVEDVAHGVDIAMNSRALADKTYRYFCGVMWRTLRERQERAVQILEEQDGE